MSDRLLRRREVELETGLSRTTIYRKMDEGRFPRPRRLQGTRTVRWAEGDIAAWKASQPRAERRA